MTRFITDNEGLSAYNINNIQEIYIYRFEDDNWSVLAKMTCGESSKILIDGLSTQKALLYFNTIVSGINERTKN